MPGESRAEERAHRVAVQVRCPLPAPEGSAGAAQGGSRVDSGVCCRDRGKTATPAISEAEEI